MSINCWKEDDIDSTISRVDTGDDDRISKEEFTSDALKGAMEKVTKLHLLDLLSCAQSITRQHVCHSG